MNIRPTRELEGTGLKGESLGDRGCGGNSADKWGSSTGTGLVVAGSGGLAAVAIPCSVSPSHLTALRETVPCLYGGILNEVPSNGGQRASIGGFAVPRQRNLWWNTDSGPICFELTARAPQSGPPCEGTFLPRAGALYCGSKYAQNLGNESVFWDIAVIPRNRTDA